MRVLGMIDHIEYLRYLASCITIAVSFTKERILVAEDCHPVPKKVIKRMKGAILQKN